MDPLEQARRLKRLKVAQLVENIASPLQKYFALAEAFQSRYGFEFVRIF